MEESNERGSQEGKEEMWIEEAGDPRLAGAAVQDTPESEAEVDMKAERKSNFDEQVSEESEAMLELFHAACEEDDWR